MIKNYKNEKITANELAKQLIIDAMMKLDYWQESVVVDIEAMTEKEMKSVQKQVSKYVDKILIKFCGFRKTKSF